jgi:hypothetical protein
MRPEEIVPDASIRGGTMATETWTLYFDRTLLGNPNGVFPSTQTLTVETNNNFSYDITVNEGGSWHSRTFTCTWSTQGLDLLLARDDSANNHYYRGRIHKRTITRSSQISQIIVVGILGHSPDPYPDSGVGNEDNVVIFTGIT